MTHAEWIRWMLGAFGLAIVALPTAAFVGWYDRTPKGKAVAAIAGIVGGAGFLALVLLGFLPTHS